MRTFMSVVPMQSTLYMQMVSLVSMFALEEYNKRPFSSFDVGNEANPKKTVDFYIVKVGDLVTTSAI